MRSDAFWEGYRAYLDDIPRSDNPYLIHWIPKEGNNSKADDWEDG